MTLNILNDIESIRLDLSHKHKIIMDKTIGNGDHFNNIKTAQTYTIGNKKYAKIWLLTAKETNGNGWGVSPKTLDQNIMKFIGRPYVVTAQEFLEKNSEYGNQYVHPSLPMLNMEANLRHQEKFKIGTIVDVIKDGDDYSAQIELLPQYRNKSLPPFCSPAVYQANLMEPEDNFTQWEALHLAGLTEKPAYGARIAILKGTCVGTQNECKVQFKKAQLEAPILCANKQAEQKVLNNKTDILINKLKDLNNTNIKRSRLEVSMKLAQMRIAEEFKESDHKRDSDGKFTSSDSGKTKGNAFTQGKAPTKGPSNLNNDVTKQQKEYESALEDYEKSLKGEHQSPSLNEGHFREVFRQRAVTMGNRVKKITGEHPEGFEKVKTKPEDLSNVINNISRMDNPKEQSDEQIIGRLRARGFGKKESEKGLKAFREKK